MRKWDSRIEDQGDLGSCVGNAITNAYELQVRYLYPDKFVELSRLFVYYNSRLFDNSVDEDVGATVRDGLKAAQIYGICSEKLWPYNIKKFKVKPTPECYADGLSRTVTSYQSLKTVDEVIDAVNNNKPVVIGITVYDSFAKISQKDPVVKPPSNSEKYTGGGHAMTVIGYDIPKKQLLVKNSYGNDWGDRGYGWIPFDYYEAEQDESWVFDISNQTPNS